MTVQPPHREAICQAAAEILAEAGMVGLSVSAVMASAGFEVHDMESLREHYADTLRALVARVIGADVSRSVRCSQPSRSSRRGSGYGMPAGTERCWTPTFIDG